MTGIVVGQMEAAGTITGGMAMGVSGGRGAGAAGLHRIQEVEGAGDRGSRRAAKRRRWAPTANCFSDPRWRRNSIVGFLLAFAGVVGLWGIGFFSYDLFRPVLERTFTRAGPGRAKRWRARSPRGSA